MALLRFLCESTWTIRELEPHIDPLEALDAPRQEHSTYEDRKKVHECGDTVLRGFCGECPSSANEIYSIVAHIGSMELPRVARMR